MTMTVSNCHGFYSAGRTCYKLFTLFLINVLAFVAGVCIVRTIIWNFFINKSLKTKITSKKLYRTGAAGAVKDIANGIYHATITPALALGRGVFVAPFGDQFIKAEMITKYTSAGSYLGGSHIKSATGVRDMSSYSMWEIPGK